MVVKVKRKKAREMASARKRGQVMLEYVVALGVFLSMIVLCAMLLYAFRTYGVRVMNLVSTTI